MVILQLPFDSGSSWNNSLTIHNNFFDSLSYQDTTNLWFFEYSSWTKNYQDIPTFIYWVTRYGQNYPRVCAPCPSLQWRLSEFFLKVALDDHEALLMIDSTGRWREANFDVEAPLFVFTFFAFTLETKKQWVLTFSMPSCSYQIGLQGSDHAKFEFLVPLLERHES